MSLSVKDLGVLFDSKLYSDHCNSIVNKAYIRANMLLRCFHSRDRILQMTLFNTFVRPIFEYNSPVWSPHLVKDIGAIKRVQKCFTKRLKRLKNVPHTHRLTILNQPTLQSRRSRSDLICLFKILNNFTDANLKSFFTVSPIITSGTHNLRGNAFKLDIPKPRTDLLKFSYVYRVIKCWNCLLAFVCDTPSIAVFKKTVGIYV